MAATKKAKNKKTVLDNVFENSSLNTPKSYLSLAYGALTVVILFILIFLGIKALSQNQIGRITDEAVTTVNNEKAQSNQTYVVSEGDTLWSISEKFYGTGFKWTDIAKDNNISNPDQLEKGTRLIVRKVANVNTALSGDTNQAGALSPGEKITGISYTVQHGDNLWEIAVRAYGDGYKWTEIAKVNNLANPDIIHSGNILSLPR